MIFVTEPLVRFPRRPSITRRPGRGQAGGTTIVCDPDLTTAHLLTLSTRRQH